MPKGDGTGPFGTGGCLNKRGKNGFCFISNNTRGFGRGRNRGMGLGKGLGRGNINNTRGV